MRATIAFDATYSVGRELSGVGVYSSELLAALAAAHPEAQFRLGFRSHRVRASLRQKLAPNQHRAVLSDRFLLPPGCDVFHGLNQRMPRRRFRRSVCTFHDLFVLTGDYSSPEFKAKFAAQAREAVSRTDLIITVSAFTASQVSLLLKVEPSRLRVVHHGLRPLHTPVAAKREPIVLHVGAIQHRKNIERLVKAFEQIPSDWKLVLAGSGTGYAAEQAFRTIRESSAAARIELAGYVTPGRLAELYATAGIFAFPSLDEGFGMPVVEAMAYGTPVLAANRSALPEVCGDAALLVDPLSVDSIAEGLTRLASSSTVRDQLSKAGLLRAQEFSWSKAAELTWNVYRELLGDT